MKVFCFTLTLLCVVQIILAYPRPNFAINGVVSGSATVQTSSNDLIGDITKVSAGTITLTSGYKALLDTSDALQAVGDQIVNTAGPLATQLVNLANDKSSQIDSTYSTIGTTIDNIITLLDTGLTATIAKITTATGDYISKQFADAFKNVKTTLTELKSAIAQLQKDVTTANAKAGTVMPISSAIIRQYIPAKTVNNVITQVRNLRARVQLITFVIDSSLENLVIADKFAIGMMGEVVNGAGTYPKSYTAYISSLTTLRSSLTLIYNVKSEYSPYKTVYSFFYSSLNANNKYKTVLGPVVEALANTYTSYVGSLSGQHFVSFDINVYNVPLLIPNLNTKLAAILCTTIQTISKVQITNAGNSDFCFSKYSPRVFSQVGLTLDAFDVCFEKELNRLERLIPIITRINQQQIFSIGDLPNNLKECLAITDINKEGDCFVAIAPYYTELNQKLRSHMLQEINLLKTENKASYGRLGACLYTALSSTVVSSAEISSEATACLTSGPQ